MRVVLGEDHALLRDGLTRLLTAHDMTVVAEAADGPGLQEALTTHRPDVAVVDVRLPPSFTDEGLRAAIAARRAVPGLPVLVLSQYVEPLYARELLTGGADAAGGGPDGAGHGVGYLLKDRVFEAREFVDALHRVAAGGTALDPEVVAPLLRQDRWGLAALSPREHEVLALMAEGRSNAAIAQRLTVTLKAVDKHVASVFHKLDLPGSADDNRRVLAVLAYLQR